MPAASRKASTAGTAALTLRFRRKATRHSPQRGEPPHRGGSGTHWLDFSLRRATPTHRDQGCYQDCLLSLEVRLNGLRHMNILRIGDYRKREKVKRMIFTFPQCSMPYALCPIRITYSVYRDVVGKW